jgi:hypothetical protein
LTREQSPLAFIVQSNDADRTKLYQEIGRFVFEYSQLEAALRRHFRRKVGYKRDFGDIMSTGFDFVKLCNAVVGLSAMENNGKPDPALEKLINECKRINEVRVSVVHGSWFSSLGEDRVVHVSRNNMKRYSIFEQAGDLDKHSVAMVKLREEIADAIFEADERRQSSQAEAASKPNDLK